MTRAVASFTRLSPSRIVTMRRGTPTRWKIAVAATASGGATIAPRAKAPAQPSAGTKHVGDRGDDGRGEDHQAEREQDDRPQVRLELADRREVATREEQRRKEHEEHEIRRKLELR